MLTRDVAPPGSERKPGLDLHALLVEVEVRRGGNHRRETSIEGEETSIGAEPAVVAADNARNRTVLSRVIVGLALGGIVAVSVFLTTTGGSILGEPGPGTKAPLEQGVSDASGDGTPLAGAAAGESQAGASVSDAAQLGADPALLPPLTPGDVVPVEIVVKDVTIEIAPGVRYKAWTFDGGVPGPTIHVRQGQTIKVTYRNGGTIPHSIDFHAARIAPNRAFRDVAPGGSITYSFLARDAGVFVYHCVTAPMTMHMANGMYGAIVVEPATPLPKAEHEFVLVASEWYLNGAGTDKPAELDFEKALRMTPDIVTFNGYAGRYVERPLEAHPGHRVRLYVANAGPNLVTAFHVVGAVFDRVYPDGDMTKWLTGVQTSIVPVGGGAVFELKLDEPGLYAFVNHSFANADKGQVGLLKVGDPQGPAPHS